MVQLGATFKVHVYLKQNKLRRMLHILMFVKVRRPFLCTWVDNLHADI